MFKSVPQEKILEFLNIEFSKIKNEYLLQKTSKKFKYHILKKKIRKLLNDIELILKTTSFENGTSIKVINLKKEVEKYFSWLL